MLNNKDINLQNSDLNSKGSSKKKPCFSSKIKQTEWTSYDNHPAYSKFIKNSTLALKCIAILTFIKFLFIVLFKKIVSYEDIPADIRKPKSISGLNSYLKYYSHLILKKTKVSRYTAVTNEAKNCLNSLVEHGIFVTHLSDEHFLKIERSSMPIFHKLRKRRSSNQEVIRDFSDSRISASQEDDNTLFNMIETSLNERGIIEAASIYAGRPVRIVDINPQINDTSDDFWQRIFPDLENKLPSTAYLHRDASGSKLKAIIYISDVNLDNGPFSYIIGSHKSKPGFILNLIQTTNDTSGFSSTDISFRKKFSALPAFLRSKCSFGNDVIHHDIENQLLNSLWMVTGVKGCVVLFDSKGIHRGGMVTNSERVVITCSLN